MRVWLSIALMAALTACGDGNPFDDNSNGEDGGIPDGSTNDIPESLASNLQTATYDPATGMLQLHLTSLDASPIIASYVRTPGLDVGGYEAYTVQDDPLDRHFTAMVAQSPDGTVRAGVVSDGGQFNRFYSGGFYERTGAYQPPSVSGPTTGLVSYAGNYAGVTNLNAPGGPELLPPPGGADPSILPAQSARTQGQIFLNVDFGNNAVNGNINSRTLVDAGTALPTVVLVDGAIAGDGTFLGKIEYDGDPTLQIGDFGGIFGGANAASVGGIVSLDQFFDDTSIAQGAERERGVFVLVQCGQPGDDPACP